MKNKIHLVLLLWTLSLLTLAGCSDKKSDDTMIKVGASTLPHAQILNAMKGYVKERGYTLVVEEFADYVQPNRALNDGELDANFFQHQPYLDSFNEQNGTSLLNAAAIHFEPLGIYSNKLHSLSELKKGDSVAIPNDTTNEARALLLLEANGLIKLQKDTGIAATIMDIIDNPLELSFDELDAAMIPRTLENVTIAIINGNYALTAGLNVQKDALAMEDVNSLSAQTYTNILVVKAENKDSEKTKVLIDALTSDECRDYIESIYEGAIVPVF